MPGTGRVHSCVVPDGWASVGTIVGYGTVNKVAKATSDSHPVESDDLAVDTGEL